MPTFWQVARRPRWIGALLLSLGIAAGFAALGQWQLDRSLAASRAPSTTTETVVPLDGFAEPGEGITDAQLGQRVSLRGSFAPGDFLVLSHRLNGGVEGWWLVGRLTTSIGGQDADLAVALGWAATEAEARAAIASAPSGEVALTGRYLPGEAPLESDFEAGEHSAMAPSDFVNLWGEPIRPTFEAYVIDEAAPAGLAAIDAPPPTSGFGINWLNIFYAIEWALFAGFAVYLWWRLVMDAVEAERGVRET